MTTQIRGTLQAPRIEARAFATGATAAAGQVSALTELANDCAGGNPAQRMTVPFDATHTTSPDAYNTFYVPTVVARFLRVQLVALSESTTGTIDTSIAVQLSITDSASNLVAWTDPSIPAALAGVAQTASFGNAMPLRWQSNATWNVSWLDIDALVLAGLVIANAPWVFHWAITNNANSHGRLGIIQVEERARFVVDESESFGQIPSDYLPRNLVVDGSPDGLERLWQTVRVGNISGLRTYHCMCRWESDPWVISSGSYVTFGGSDEESGGVPAAYRVRPRKMRGTSACPVRFCVRYKFSGGSAGATATVLLSTGGTSHTLVVTWADNTDWHDSALQTGATLSNASTEDRLHWTAKVSGATSVSICSRLVVEAPTP